MNLLGNYKIRWCDKHGRYFEFGYSHFGCPSCVELLEKKSKTMKKYFVIKNWDSKLYFTCFNAKLWTKDLGQAYYFNSEEEIDSFLRIEDNKEHFETVSLIIIETIYKND